MLNVPKICCVSISFRTAAAEIREKLSFGQEVIKDMLCELKEQSIQSVILCTCNRTEVYFCGSEQAVVQMLSERSGIQEKELSERLNIYEDERALRHLFRVAGGMTSMVIGEDEILGQTRQAYNLAAECGSVGYELNRCFQDALACGKKIRSETFISQIPLSTATIAANAAAGFADEVRVLVIGASGSIGSSVVKNLLGHKNVTVSATSRRHGEDVLLSRRVRTIDFADRYREIAAADCIISATSSPHRTVTLSRLTENNISGRKLFIDLAVPADIDRCIGGFGEFERIDIDGIGELAEKNSLARQDSARAAAEIIDRETDRLKKELLFHFNSALFGDICLQMESSPQSVIYKLKGSLAAEQFEAVLKAFGEM
ncbi:MAG: glutamyl-tRNA reductase [Ruminococcus sp.]|nr:glutamyl-tRNA reductase [Ruminococcus sp.]